MIPFSIPLVEWRPRGFSIGLAASSPGFDLRPHHHRTGRRGLSSSTSTLPHHSTLDTLIREAVPTLEETAEGGNESPSRRWKSTALAQSRSMRGSLSGSLYVGPSPTCSAGGISGHRRNRSSGTTISLPTTPLVGGFDSTPQHEGDEVSSSRESEGSGRNWWKFWSRRKEGNIVLT